MSAQVIDLFPLWAALHTGSRPLDLEFRGRAGICSHGDCVSVPCAAIVGRRTLNEFDPEILDFGI